MCVYTFTFRYPDFYGNLHLLCCVPPSSIEEIFFQKQLPKKIFMGWGTFGGNFWGEAHEVTNDQIMSR